jgi:hypothetical protein
MDGGKEERWSGESSGTDKPGTKTKEVERESETDAIHSIKKAISD